MEATAEELKWAIAIKEAAITDPNIDCDSFCDLDYLQHGIIAKDRVDKALSRLRNLQKMKRKFGIQDRYHSLADSMRDITTFQRENPGVLLSRAAPSRKDEEGNICDYQPSVVCADVSRMQASKFKGNEENIAIAMRCFYHGLQACNHTLDAMRCGLSVVVNARGTGLHNFAPSLESSLATLYSRAYPVRIQLMVSIGCPRIIRLLFELVLKLFATKKVREKHVFCTDFGDLPLPKDVLPAEWGGTQAESWEVTAQKNLQERYLLEEKFKL